MTPDEAEILRGMIQAAEMQAREFRALHGSVERLLPLMLKNGSCGTQSKATVNQTDRTPMWVCVVLVVALVVGTWGRGDQSREDISRLQSDIRELRAVDQDLRATDNAVRAYINTGILKQRQEQKK